MVLPFRSMSEMDEQNRQFFEEFNRVRSPFQRPFNMFDVAGGIMNTNSARSVLPLESLGFNTSTGVANEPDVIGTYRDKYDIYRNDDGDPVYMYQGDEYSAPGNFDQQRRSGIQGLIDYVRNLSIPSTLLGYASAPFSFIGRGLQSFDRGLRGTDFGSSRTLAEYAQKRRERKQAERAQENFRDVYDSAREQGFTNDRGGFSTNKADKAGTSLGSGQFSPSSSRGRSGY